jgi:glycine oxidase
MRGQILLYKPAENLKQIVYQDGFYMIPRADGQLLAGSTLEDVGFDASVTEEVKAELAKKAEAIMPSLKDLPIIKHWSGLRPGTPENLPTISAHPQIQNLYLNTGHFRYGLTMAPASARLISELMASEKPFIDASPFALEID